MKVKHSVMTDDKECSDLYVIATTACLATYTTIEEQNAAILAAQNIFKTKLDELVLKAFKIGKKMGKKSSDTMDTTMYSEEVTTAPIL